MNNANLYALFHERFPSDTQALFLDGIDGRQLRYSEIPQRSGQMLSLLSTVTLEPKPIPLDVKVALLGDRLL